MTEGDHATDHVNAAAESTDRPDDREPPSDASPATKGQPVLVLDPAECPLDAREG